MIASDDQMIRQSVSGSTPSSDILRHEAGSQWLEGQSSSMVAALARLVAHPSYFQADQSNTPFGLAIDNCLDDVLALARELGLRGYKDPAGLYGYVELPGEASANVIGILCHLDVNAPVEVGDWFSDPLVLEQRNGLFYGCGVQQNKGAVVAALFAMRALQESGAPIRHTIRLILGLDANREWQSVSGYIRQERVPDISFSPTGTFPVVYAEKRLLQVSLYGPGSNELSIVCGGTFGSVPDRAIYQGKRQKALQKRLDSVNFPWYDDNGVTVVLGQPAPAERCDCAGINAIIRLSQALLSIGYQHPALGFCSLVVGNDPHVRALLGDIEDACSGKLTVNLSGLQIDEQESRIDLDIRIPVTVDIESFRAQLQQAVARLGWRYDELRHLPPLHIAESSPLVTLLSDSYRDITGDARRAIASGGASFARSLPNCVSFGALFPEFPNTANQANEHLALDNLVCGSKIFACALSRLQQIPLGISLGRQH